MTSPTSSTDQDEAVKMWTAACTKHATFAVLPCSKQSWRSSLSVHIALKGLEIEKQASQEQFKAYLIAVKDLKELKVPEVLVCTDWAQEMQRSSHLCLFFLLYMSQAAASLTIRRPTCSCQEGYPRSSGHGGLQTLPSRRSSPGCTESQVQQRREVSEDPR